MSQTRRYVRIDWLLALLYLNFLGRFSRAFSLRSLPTTSLPVVPLPDATTVNPPVALRLATGPTTTKANGNDFEGNDDDDDEIILQLQQHHDETNGANSMSSISKAKWKKKRFLIIKDVNAAIQTNNPRAPRKAAAAVRRMWQLYDLTDGSDDDFKPNTQVYNLWIHAVAKSRGRDCGPQAEAILKEMQDRGVVPNVISYTTVMDAYANQARFGDATAPEHAERVLFDLIARAELDSSLRVTAVTADVAMNAWAQQGTWQGAARAQQILDRLSVLSSSSSSSSSSSLSSGKSGNRGSTLCPTVHSYATVIHGWAQSKGGTEAAQQAERVLRALLRSSDGAVKPDTIVFNAVIDAWSSSGDARAGTKALKWLNQMKELSQTAGYDCEPDVVTYNTALSAWSHSGHINAASKAEQILKSMLEAHREMPDDRPAPNTVSYNCVLHAWSRGSSPVAVERAETILHFMINSNDPNIAPDAYSFTSVLNTLGKSKQPNKAHRARQYLDTMLEMYAATKRESLRPTQVPFNAILNAAAFSALGTPEEEQRSALKIAVETFSLMKKLSVQADTISYGNMLKIVANLVPRGSTRTEMGLQLFKRCCQDGLVGDLVWQEARRALPARVLSDLIRTQKPLSAIQIKDLPKSWRKNLPRERRMHAKPKNKAKVTPDPTEAKRREPIQRFRNINEQSYQSERDV